MNCPICNIELRPADRQGIEIDYCPKCRGVWVAREELDRILVHPTPFDIDWCQDEMEQPASFNRGCVPSRSKHKVENQAWGPRPGFWSNLFA
jgi:Zn-finger nucleic acid-binding protein